MNTAASTPGNLHTTGLIRNGATFDGADDYVEITDHGTLDLTTDLTIAAWIYPLSFGEGSEGSIVDKDFTGAYALFLDDNPDLAGEDNTIHFNGGNSTVRLIASNNSIKLNQWQHVAVTYDDPSAIFYINGVATTSISDAGPIPTNTTDLRIGNDPSAGFTFDGKIDEVYLYNRALSANEIGRLYNATKKVTVNAPITLDLTNGLIDYWSFNGQDMSWANASNTIDRGSNVTSGNTVAMSTTTSVVPGRVGQALNFDNTKSQYVNLQYKNIGTTLTYSFWAKQSKANTGNTQDAFSYMKTIVRFGAGTTLQFYTDTDQGAATNDAWSEDTNWHFFAFTITGTTARVYIDGNLLAQTTVSFGINTGTGGVGANNIGKGNGTFYYGGIIDEVRVYNRVLSDNEVKQLYQMSRPVAH